MYCICLSFYLCACIVIVSDLFVNNVSDESTIKDDFYSVFFDGFFLKCYIYCRKCNAEVIKFMKTVGHRARFFET